MRNNAASLKLIYFSLINSTLIYAVIVWLLYGKRTPAMTMEQSLHRLEVLIPMVTSLAMFVVQFAITGSARERIILRWAIIESSSVLALVAAFVSMDWRFYAIGWTLSLAGFALSFPSAQEA